MWAGTSRKAESMKINEELISKLRAGIKDILSLVRSIRRSIHSEPEIALKEHKTRKKIADALSDTSLTVWEPLLGTDLVGELKGNGNETVLLRADMDALPIREETGVPYCSTVPGMMHACGHDGHIAILIGTVLVLDALKEYLNASVRFVFQPAEELTCAGADLVRLGVCDGVEAVFALHCWPGLAMGSVSTRAGPAFAAADHFRIEFTGKGCHGAMPETGNNPITPAARLASELDEMHRRENAADGSVISVCTLHAGDSSNVIPDKSVLRGTMRYLSKERGDELEGRITLLAKRIAAGSGIEVDVVHERKYALPVINSHRGYALVRDLATEHLGTERFVELEKPSMGAEDFAFYLDGRDGAMFRLGVGEERPRLHTCKFDFNDDALETGILMLSLIALNS